MGFSSLQIAINAEIIYVRITMSLSRSSNALLQAARYLVFAAAVEYPYHYGLFDPLSTETNGTKRHTDTIHKTGKSLFYNMEG